MTAQAQLAVLGAGPAGLAAAIRAEQLGLDVVLVAPPRPPTHRVGEALAPGAAGLLRRLGAQDLLGPPHIAVQCTYSAWGRARVVPRHAMARVGGLGWTLDRGHLEDELRGRFQGRQVQARVNEIEDHGASAGSGPWRLHTSEGPVDARFLVDATGRSAVVARRFGSVLRGDGLVAAWALLDPEEGDVARTPGGLVESATEGWWYSAVLPDGRLSLVWFTDADLLPKGLSSDLEAWRALLATSVLTAARVESAAFALADAPRTAAVGGVHRTEVWGPGWAAVGDAAGARDPLSSHGMSVALWGGLTVAEAVPTALVGDTAGLTDYGRTLARARKRYEAERTEVYDSERRFDTPFWRRRRRPSQTE